MRPSKRIAAGTACLALVLGAGAGIADAAQKDGSGSSTAAAAKGGPGGPGPGPGAQAIADYVGLTTAELRTQLTSGKTLAQVATAQGKTVDGLEAAIVADATTHLDADVAAGTITAAQEASRLADLKSHVDDMVNSTGPPGGGRGPGGPGGPGGGPFDAQAIASYLGLTTDALRTQLQSGTSLADVATAQGKTVAGLEAAITAAATTKLDAAVAAGTITSSQESARLADLKAHLDDMVNSTGPPHGGPGAGGPPPNGSASSSTAAFGTRL
jgi:hypothetical protein